MKFKLSKDCSKLTLVESSREEFNQIKRLLKPKVNNYRFMQRYKLGLWDGSIDFFNSGVINFGLWNTVYEICKEYGYKFEIENKSDFPKDNDITLEQVTKFCEDFYKDHKTKDGKPFTPYLHQIEAMFKMLKHKYGLIEVATSGGKSLIFSSFVFYYLKNINPKAKILLIVPSISLVTQMYDDILDYNLGYNKDNKTPLNLELLEIMSDHPRKSRDGFEPNIYIGTYQSLIKYGTKELQPDFYKQFDIVCTDESHMAKAASLTTILTKTFGLAKYRLGMSGTYPEKLTAEMMTIESVIGPKLYSVKARELMDKGLISNVKIKALLLQYEELEFTNNVLTIKKNGGGKKAFELEREFAQKSEKRLAFVGRLVNKFTGNSLLLFNNIEYGTNLYNYLRDNVQNKEFYYIDGEIGAEKREYIKKQMELMDGKIRICIASYGTLSTGVSIKQIMNIILCDSSKSPFRIIQSIGRALRLHKNKVNAIIFDLVDQFHSKHKTTTLYKHYEVRRDKMYKVQDYPFEEFKVLL